MPDNTKKLVYNEVKEVSFFDELLEWNKDNHSIIGLSLFVLGYR